MKSYTIKGGGGTKLHVEETGNPHGRPILLIHGFSQSRLCWNKQFHSSLAHGHRLVRLDNRGHGLSEKPKGAYGDSKLWAEDVNAIIGELGLKSPILSGWSYGGVIICDYVRSYGEASLGGIQFVGAVTKLGDPVIPFLTADCLSCVPGVFSTDAEESVAVLQRFLGYCVAAAPSPEDLYFFLGYNTAVPPHVREALFSRVVDNDDLLPKLKKSVLITHGSLDGLVRTEMAHHIAKKMPNARLSMYQGIGHSTFWEDPERFNRELADFAASLA